MTVYTEHVSPWTLLGCLAFIALCVVVVGTLGVMVYDDYHRARATERQLDGMLRSVPAYLGREFGGER